MHLSRLHDSYGNHLCSKCRSVKRGEYCSRSSCERSYGGLQAKRAEAQQTLSAAGYTGSMALTDVTLADVLEINRPRQPAKPVGFGASLYAPPPARGLQDVLEKARAPIAIDPAQLHAPLRPYQEKALRDTLAELTGAAQSSFKHMEEAKASASPYDALAALFSGGVTQPTLKEMFGRLAQHSVCKEPPSKPQPPQRGLAGNAVHLVANVRAGDIAFLRTRVDERIRLFNANGAKAALALASDIGIDGLRFVNLCVGTRVVVCSHESLRGFVEAVNAGMYQTLEADVGVEVLLEVENTSDRDVYLSVYFATELLRWTPIEGQPSLWRDSETGDIKRV